MRRAQLAWTASNAICHALEEHDFEQDSGPTLRDRYDCYVSNARAMNWEVKSFDEWLVS